MIRMRHLVDVLELGLVVQQYAVGHSPAGFLLTERQQECPSGGVGLDIGKAHVTLQVVACLGVVAQAVNITVVEHLSRQPMFNEIIRRFTRVSICNTPRPWAIYSAYSR